MKDTLKQTLSRKDTLKQTLSRKDDAGVACEIADLAAEFRAAGKKNAAIIAHSIQNRLMRAKDSRDEADRLRKLAEDLELSAISDEAIAHENTERLAVLIDPASKLVVNQGALDAMTDTLKQTLSSKDDAGVPWAGAWTLL